MIRSSLWQMQKYQDVDCSPIDDMCSGCTNKGKARCQVTTEPIYFWEKYGKCPFKMTVTQFNRYEAEMALRARYSPDPFRWIKTIQDLREEGLIP